MAEIASGDWGWGEPSEGLDRCRVIRGTDFGKVASGSFAEVPVRYLAPKRLRARSLVTGDLLVEMSGGSESQATGRALLVTDDVLAASDCPTVSSNFVKRIRLVPGQDPQFVRYLWEWLYRQGRTRTYEQRTTGIRNFKLESFLAKESVAVPSLAEQRAIAQILRTVQQAEQATEQVLAAARWLKRSMLRYLFTYGPVPIGKADAVAVRESVLGPIPDAWPLTRLDDPLDTQLGKMLSPKARSGGDPRPYLRNANVQWGRFDIADVATMHFTTDELVKFELKYGDVLVCEGGEIGRAAMWRNELPGCLFQKALHRLRPRDGRMRPEFVVYYLMSAFLLRRASVQVGTTTTIAHLPAEKLKALPIPVPSVAGQDAIISPLQAVDRKIVAEEQRRDSLAAVFEGLLHDLMSARVRVPTPDLAAAAS